MSDDFASAPIAIPSGTFSEQTARFEQSAYALSFIVNDDHLGLISAALLQRDLRSAGFTTSKNLQIFGSHAWLNVEYGAWVILGYGKGDKMSYDLFVAFSPHHRRPIRIGKTVYNAHEVRALIERFERPRPRGEKRPSLITGFIRLAKHDLTEEKDLPPRHRVAALAALERLRRGEPAGFAAFSIDD